MKGGKKKSKYLNVICDREGLDINVKQRYGEFWRKGDELFSFKAGEERSERQLPVEPCMDKPDPAEGEVLGYFIAVPIWGIYCEHIPILVPYTGQLNKAGTDIRNYSNMPGPDDINGPLWTERQWLLNVICFEMEGIAWLADKKVWCNKIYSDREVVASRQAQIFTLWHQVWPYLVSMPFTKFYGSIDRGLLRGKPCKRHVSAAMLHDDRPEICFKLCDCKDYYALLMLVRVGKRVFKPSEFTGLFFTASEKQPDEYYLWDCIQDVRVAAFFKDFGYGFSILKCHYEGDFAVFFERLREGYEVSFSGLLV